MTIEQLTPTTIKVIITSSTTIEEFETMCPRLKVLQDDKGLYIRTPYCRFVPGTYVTITNGKPKHYLSGDLL